MSNARLKLLFISEASYAENFAADKAITDRFIALYQENFPEDADASEDIGHILSRVKGNRNPYDPLSYLLIAIDKSNQQLVGGMVLEFYQNSQCAHLTYLFIDSKARHHGYGPEMVRRGLPLCIEKIQAIHRRAEKDFVKALFFETYHPAFVEIKEMQAKLKNRLRLFQRHNIKWIDIPYVQPCFPGKRRAYNLLLMAFPQEGRALQKNVVMGFLKDLYHSLEYGSHGLPFDENDVDFRRMEAAMEDGVLLKDIDLLS